jgi:hypothetical protein
LGCPQSPEGALQNKPDAFTSGISERKEGEMKKEVRFLISLLIVFC